MSIEPPEAHDPRQMSPVPGFFCQLAAALYLDAGYILDSIWRRAEFNLHRYFRYRITSVSSAPAATDTEADATRHPNPPPPFYAGMHAEVQLTPRAQFSLPRFWFFAAVIVFVAYGPTLDSLCSILGTQGMQRARYIVGAALVIAAACLLAVLARYGIQRARRRFDKAKVPPQDTVRRATVYTLVEAGMIIFLLPMTLLGISLWRQADAPICHPVVDTTPALLQLVVTLAALTGAAFVARRRAATTDPRIPLVDLTVLGLLVALLWLWVAAPSPSEATQTPYPHVYAVLGLGMALIAAVSRLWARRMFRSTVNDQRDFFKHALSRTEIFPDARIDPILSGHRIAAATLIGILQNLLQLLLLPAFFLLIVPSERIVLTVIFGLIASVGLVTVGSLTTRWQQMLVYIKRWFFIGTPLITSLAVIALAALRLWKVQYVATVLDAAPFGVIFIWIVMSYVLSWWFEYVINEAAARELLRLLGTDSQAQSGLVPYCPDPQAPITMPADHRWIAPHGMGRLVAMGWCPDKDTKEPLAVFQAFDFIELFTRITPAGREETRNDLTRQLRLYFFGLNLALVAGLALFLTYYGHGDRTNTVAPVVAAGKPDATWAPADLESLLVQQAQKGRPAIIVATSGGGTRAALFTASALQGLAKLGVSQDIVLLSGVSGGGVAAAYFYAHQKDLRSPYEGSQQAWRDFEYHMTDPFIADVLEGAMEWRVVSRMALGVLLKESFERELFTSDGLQNVGGAARPALILNTTVTGSPAEDSDILDGRFLQPRKEQTCDQRHLPYANVSGGRLIFTNLRDRSAFPDAGRSAAAQRKADDWPIADVRLPYVVVQDPKVPLASAAALNANFPPVFTNARVDVPLPPDVHDEQCPTRPYYVTDGGATENLGFVSALYALRKALRDMEATSAPIPKIHLVLIEASATTYDYTPDRGINAATGGSKERLTGGLTVELVDEINKEFKQAYPNADPIKPHYLVMPLAFRSRGGFGTHWMFPPSIAIENPRTPRPVSGFGSNKRKVLLNRTNLIALWEQLHDPQKGFCGDGPFVPVRDEAMQTVADWVCGRTKSQKLPPDLHIEQWNKLVEQLGPNRTNESHPPRVPISQLASADEH